LQVLPVNCGLNCAVERGVRTAQRAIPTSFFELSHYPTNLWLAFARR
jgi:hypothetical protein